MKSFKAFVFDFDGTLAELNIDFKIMKARVISLSREYGIADEESLKDLLILELIEAVRERISREDQSGSAAFFRAAHALIEEIEIEAACRSVLLSGTLTLLKTLKKRGHAVGIITRNCHAALTCVFPEIEDYCDVLLSRNHTTNVKPHPDHLLRTLTLLDADPGQAVMVGDHPLDIGLGRKVGTYTIGVLTGHSSAAMLTASGADRVLNRAVEILDLLT
ncbi:phosphoglycolate phosphatase [Syntrophus gentianae]|uniref:phosphoglycolate phosphatase n=1 Tax=Syntrophus gentianae TaxID=43775 RepID=A0A1H7XWA8_9BACT|nr:HAD-IA family hydrolase [Syntrophus gentianae]SEM37953.1 phosphoglycolate phosphatase [Syntrophus gentianae]